MIAELADWCADADLPAGVKQACERAEEWVPKAQLYKSIDQLAVRLTVELQDRHPLLVAMSPDGIWLMGMLLQRMVFPLRLVTAMATGGRSSETWALSERLEEPVPVILVVGGGGVSSTLLTQLQSVSPHVLSVALLDLQRSGVDYAALPTPDHDVMGAGLFIEGYGINLPALYRI